MRGPLIRNQLDSWSVPIWASRLLSTGFTPGTSFFEPLVLTHQTAGENQHRVAGIAESPGTKLMTKHEISNPSP